ncbi:hypothetical protein ZIOFF_071382 [Zingiber officinale]|uniref:Uncharacterized protein n=1 Tax=Zingiber officinale TaxID=94328 RepID=A0A8J5C9L1_ZINOF|nr:hypothetical protein ZIOFF_071382 [Zingiber officinale]
MLGWREHRWDSREDLIDTRYRPEVSGVLCRSWFVEIKLLLVNMVIHVMAARRSNGELGGQNSQFLTELTALLLEQNRVHGEQIQQLLRAREDRHAHSHPTITANPVHRHFKELGPMKFKGATNPLVAEE